MTDTDKILTKDELKDTTRLQLESLVAYMKALDYGYLYGDKFFYSGNRENKARRIVSFSTATKLYNGHYNDNHGRGMDDPFSFDAYSINKAQASKTIQKVKLQLCKNTGYIKTSSHIVEFTKPIYYQMWINSKCFPF